MKKSETVSYIGQKCEGYVINAEFSEQNLPQLLQLIDKIKTNFGQKVFCMDAHNLHITLMDWIAPFADYGGLDKKAIFDDLYPVYQKTLSDILAQYKTPIKVKFKNLEVHPTTVIIKGEDDGSFNKIREEFVARAGLLPETKKPPVIIHSSICRFVEPIDLDEMKKILKKSKVKFKENISEFYLKNTHVEPQLEFDKLHTFKIGRIE